MEDPTAVYFDSKGVLAFASFAACVTASLGRPPAVFESDEEGRLAACAATAMEAAGCVVDVDLSGPLSPAASRGDDGGVDRVLDLDIADEHGPHGHTHHPASLEAREDTTPGEKASGTTGCAAGVAAAGAAVYMGAMTAMSAAFSQDDDIDATADATVEATIVEATTVEATTAVLMAMEMESAQAALAVGAAVTQPPWTPASAEHVGAAVGKEPSGYMSGHMSGHRSGESGESAKDVAGAAAAVSSVPSSPTSSSDNVGRNPYRERRRQQSRGRGRRDGIARVTAAGYGGAPSTALPPDADRAVRLQGTGIAEYKFRGRLVWRPSDAAMLKTWDAVLAYLQRRVSSDAPLVAQGAEVADAGGGRDAARLAAMHDASPGPSRQERRRVMNQIAAFRSRTKRREMEERRRLALLRIVAEAKRVLAHARRGGADANVADATVALMSGLERINGIANEVVL
jgi:hypothetical protein